MRGCARAPQTARIRDGLAGGRTMMANCRSLGVWHCFGLAVVALTMIGTLPSLAQELPMRQSSKDFRVTRLPLPDANGVVALDYFAYERRHGRIWVPASNLGVVAVIDTETDKITTVGGFRTGEVEFGGKKRLLGPTSVAIGDGVVYIGSRGDY